MRAVLLLTVLDCKVFPSSYVALTLLAAAAVTWECARAGYVRCVVGLAWFVLTNLSLLHVIAMHLVCCTY